MLVQISSKKEFAFIIMAKKNFFFWGGGQMEQMAPLGLPSSAGPAGTEAVAWAV